MNRKSCKGGLNIMRSTLSWKMEWTVTKCIQTAEPYAEPANDVDIEMAIRKIEKWNSNWTLSDPG
jgi:hypothetical protein